MRWLISIERRQTYFARRITEPKRTIAVVSFKGISLVTPRHPPPPSRPRFLFFFFFFLFCCCRGAPHRLVLSHDTSVQIHTVGVRFAFPTRVIYLMYMMFSKDLLIPPVGAFNNSMYGEPVDPGSSVGTS